MLSSTSCLLEWFQRDGVLSLGVCCRFFIVKSSNRENLELSVARGLWATHRNNEAKLNEAFDSCDNVILIFSVNETGHFQVFFNPERFV